MPLLASNHTVIVPDLRGAGGSSKPESSYDKKNMAVDIHNLVKSLGFNRAAIQAEGQEFPTKGCFTFSSPLNRPRALRELVPS